jgi:hypothetical protein
MELVWLSMVSMLIGVNLMEIQWWSRVKQGHLVLRDLLCRQTFDYLIFDCLIV